MATKVNKQGPGTLIRKARHAMNMTQRDLADAVGVKASHIAYIEGEQRNPSLSLLRKIADALGLNRQELLLMIHPEARHLTQDGSEAASNGHSKPDGWHQFSSNRALLQRHRVSPGELKVLKMVSALGTIASPRSYLFILNSIRMAAGSAP